jgi:hypothetical protein
MRVRKIIVGGIALAVGLSTALASGAFAGGNGAQKAGLSATSGGQSNCNSGSSGNGWAILNGPGKPGAIKFINGEVHLVDPAAPNQTFDIYIGNGNGGGMDCMMTMDTLTTNAQGIGNGHISNAAGMGGQHFVALFQGTDEKYASAPVIIN